MPALRSTLRMAPREVLTTRDADGSVILRSPQPLTVDVERVTDWLRLGAERHPDRTLLAERDGDHWRTVSYAQALDTARRIGQALLDRQLSVERPVAVLSENSIEHALLMLGAMWVGVPVMPISPAYSLASTDHAKLRAIVSLTTPGMVYAHDAARHAPALRAIGMEATPYDALIASDPTHAVDAAHRATDADTIAKILFTSGSTGTPKAVINTHRMLVANQAQCAQVWPFLEDRPPVLMDWLPWNHTFGGNFNFNLVLRNGGSLYIDEGKPVPGLIEKTVRNLRDVPVTAYFNVPRAFDLILPYLERDAELRRHFFKHCDFVIYAGASLPQNLWERFEALAWQERDGDLALVSSWGSTETAPMCTAVHFPIAGAGIVGLPVPGVEMKLIPCEGKLEARLKGPNITPGYFRQPEATATAFDADGYYRIGDAMKFMDADHPELGLVFDGRVAEDFKLRTGTWVHVGTLRVKLIAALNPWVQDAVITGHDRDEVGALLFLNPNAAGSVDRATLRVAIETGLKAFNAQPGASSSTRVTRVSIEAEPARVDLGEITDKGYINQRAVLTQRAGTVEAIHAGTPGPHIVHTSGG